MLQVKNILDKDTWESFLAKTTNSSFPFFQTWNWGEIQKKLNNQVYPLGLFDNEKLVGVCLVIDVKAKRGHYLYLRHGPVVLDPREENLSFFLKDIRNFAKGKGISFL